MVPSRKGRFTRSTAAIAFLAALCALLAVVACGRSGEEGDPPTTSPSRTALAARATPTIPRDGDPASTHIGIDVLATPRGVTPAPGQVAPPILPVSTLPPLATTRPLPTFPPFPTARPLPTLPPLPTLRPLPTFPPFPTIPPDELIGTILVQSCIEGNFEGWDGETVFQLCNGQVWIQSSFEFWFHFAFRPQVTIYQTPSGTEMYVDGTDESVLVQQVTDYTRTCIDGDFEGWEGDTVFALCNGEVWMQSEYDYTYSYAYSPDVLIYWDGYGYRMRVDGEDDSVGVQQVTDFFRTCIDGDFEGWEGETVFTLCNGQVWQQTDYAYSYHYAYRPDVLIYWDGYQYRMKVAGVAETIAVSRIA